MTVTVKARKVTVTGPRGTLTRKFRHQAMEISSDGQNIMVRSWHSKRQKLSCIRTFASHIKNMMTGVTQGFRYKMRLVYAHFPINVNIVDDGKVLEIRNFIGEKLTRVVPMQDGCSIARGDGTVKDELIVEGNDIEKVSLSCSMCRTATLVRNKDIRKFLDGVYVSSAEAIPVDE